MYAAAIGVTENETNKMTNETATIIVAGAILAGRVWSAFEHRSTGKDVKEIKIYMNGENEKKLQEKYDEGFKDGKNDKSK